MNEKLDQLLEQYGAAAGERWLEENMPAELPEHTFSQKFQRRMNKLLRRQLRSPGTRAALAYVRRAAVFVLAFVVLSFSVRMTVDAAFRKQVLQAVVQIFPTLRSSAIPLMCRTMGSLENWNLPICRRG